MPHPPGPGSVSSYRPVQGRQDLPFDHQEQLREGDVRQGQSEAWARQGRASEHERARECQQWGEVTHPTPVQYVSMIFTVSESPQGSSLIPSRGHPNPRVTVYLTDIQYLYTLGQHLSFVMKSNSLFLFQVQQLSKKEIEDLLRKGAYGALMDEEDEGSKFCEEDIDQILQRRTHTITIESEGKGSTFAKVYSLLVSTTSCRPALLYTT